LSADPSTLPERVLKRRWRGSGARWRAESRWLSSTGGRARGYALRGDYDVAVLMEQGCDLYKLGELVVDAAEAARAPFSLLLDVLGRGKVVYCRDEDELFEDKLRAIKMYDDWLNFSKYFIEREIKKVTG